MTSEDVRDPATQTASRKYKPFDMLVTIVDRGMGEQVAEYNRDEGINVNFICLGRGTADSVWMELLSLESPEKDVVLSFVPVEEAHTALTRLVEKFDLHSNGRGIAFTIPVNSVAGSKVLHYFAGYDTEEQRS